MDGLRGQAVQSGVCRPPDVQITEANTVPSLLVEALKKRSLHRRSAIFSCRLPLLKRGFFEKRSALKHHP